MDSWQKTENAAELLDEKTILLEDEDDRTIDTKRFSEMLNGFTAGKDVISGKEIRNIQDSLTIPAKTAMVIELE